MAGFIWRSKEKKELVLPTALKRFQVTSECPCCEMKVFGKQLVIGKDADMTNHSSGCLDGQSSHPYRWYLEKWWGNGVGTPNAYWILRDVGNSRWISETGSCSGVIYAYGKIDCNGKLIGLPKWFQTNYSYDGRMMLIQGCLEKDGNINMNNCGGYNVINFPFSPNVYERNGIRAWYNHIIENESNTTSLGVFLGGTEGKGNV